MLVNQIPMCVVASYLQYVQHMRQQETSCHISECARTYTAEVQTNLRERKRPGSAAMGNTHQNPIGARGFNIGLTPAPPEPADLPVSAAKPDIDSLLYFPELSIERLTGRNHSDFQCHQCKLSMAP